MNGGALQVVIAAVTVIIPLGVESAINTKLVHASVCRAADDSRQDDLYLLHNTTGALTNNGGSELTVRCPLLTDIETNDAGLDSVSIYVDPSTAGDDQIACNVTCRGVSGTGVVDIASETSSGYDPQTLSFDDALGDIDNCVTNPFYMVNCDLDPGGSPPDGLFGIRYAENIP